MVSPALSPLTVAAPAAAPTAAHPARGAAAQPGAFASELQQAVDLGGQAATATPGDKADAGTDGNEAPCVTRRADAGTDPVAARTSAAARLRLLARATAAQAGKPAAADTDTDTDATGADPAKLRSGDKADPIDKTQLQPEPPVAVAPAVPQPPVTDTPPPAAPGAAPVLAAPGANGPVASALPATADGTAATDGPAPAADRNGADGTRPGPRAVTGSERNLAEALRDAAPRADAAPARNEARSDAALEPLAKATAQDDGVPVRTADAGTPPLPSFAGELARATQTLSGPAPTREPTALTLPTPVLSPEFVPRFSAEVAVLARDGIQEARVQVHPVELGPIAVQISVDGTAAQVQLVVENSQTHQLLEQSMPALAAALRENGLTLTGGGVFQQAGQGSGNGQGGGSSTPGGARGRGGDERDAAAPAAAPVRRTRLAGALDLYA